MVRPIIHLMHHGNYQRLNQWPGVQQHILANQPDFHIWVRSADHAQARQAFAPICKIFPGNIRFLPSKCLGKLGAYTPNLWRLLRQANPRMLIVSGYAEPYYQQAFWYAKRYKIPIVFVWESHRYSARHLNGPVHTFKKIILRHYDGFITPGSRATAYLHMLGVEDGDIFQGINATDMASLTLVINTLDGGEFVSDTPCRFLYVGRYLSLKGVRELIDAFAKIPGDQATLSMVGYGPLEKELKQQASGLSNVQFFPKFNRLDEGIRHYLNADVLVMPSTTRYGRSDVWGFVVNEALACGCYVIAGETVGSAPELITNAPLDVGFTFNPDSPEEFSRTLQSAIQTAKSRDRTAIMQWGQSIDGHYMGDAFLRAITDKGGKA